jgi:hypothetical protein
MGLPTNRVMILWLIVIFGESHLEVLQPVPQAALLNLEALLWLSFWWHLSPFKFPKEYCLFLF